MNSGNDAGENLGHDEVVFEWAVDAAVRDVDGLGRILFRLV
jgi:hypothetical protein